MSENNCKWVGVWGNAISVSERRPENYAKNLTLRYPVKMMLDGSAVRITVDNFCGNESITVTCATVALSKGDDSVTAESMRKITFGGADSVTVPSGERVVSDAVDMPVKKGEDIAVSLYFADFTEILS